MAAPAKREEAPEQGASSGSKVKVRITGVFAGFGRVDDGSRSIAYQGEEVEVTQEDADRLTGLKAAELV